MTTSPIRIAVAGAGYIGQAHMGVAQRSSNCTLSAVVDPSPAAAAIAAQAGVPLYPSIEALLAKDPPDGLILATPNALHVPQALLCMAADLPILLEKPIATTVAEGQRLVDEVERTGAKVLIGHTTVHTVPSWPRPKRWWRRANWGGWCLSWAAPPSSSQTFTSPMRPGVASWGLDPSS
jgi:predicted dehydrogenase